MRALVRTAQVLGLALLAALAAGAVVSADSSSVRQGGYTTGPTATPTTIPTPTPTPVIVCGSCGPKQPKVVLQLLKGSTAKRVKTRVRFNVAGKVKLAARRGRTKLGKKSVTFKKAGKKKARLKINAAKLGALPAKVTVTAKGRNTFGAPSKTVKKRKTLK